MLERLVVRNFQKFRKITVEFDPQITTLWGPTDSGKSTIFRLLRWICLNQRPKNHINWDSTFASGTLYVDGHTIKRKQSADENYYQVDGGEKLKAFNKGVPKPVSDILNVSAANFQRQLDAHFWVSLSPGDVSKQLNEIVDLSIIDKSLSEASLRVRRIGAKIGVIQERVEKARAKKKSLQWVRTADVDLQIIEAKQAELSVLTARRKGLEVLLQKVESYEGDLTNLGQAIVDGQELLSKAKSLVQISKRRKRLGALITDLEKSAQYTRFAIPNIKELETIRKKRLALEQIIVGLDTIEEQLCRVQKKVRISSQQLATKQPKLCPVCGKPM